MLSLSITKCTWNIFLFHFEYSHLRERLQSQKEYLARREYFIKLIKFISKWANNYL